MNNGETKTVWLMQHFSCVGNLPPHLLGGESFPRCTLFICRFSFFFFLIFADLVLLQVQFFRSPIDQFGNKIVQFVAVGVCVGGVGGQGSGG